MPTVNYLLYTNIGGANAFLCAMSMTVIFALVSWQLVEKPNLRSKRNLLGTLQVLALIMLERNVSDERSIGSAYTLGVVV